MTKTRIKCFASGLLLFILVWVRWNQHRQSRAINWAAHEIKRLGGTYDGPISIYGSEGGTCVVDDDIYCLYFSEMSPEPSAIRAVGILDTVYAITINNRTINKDFWKIIAASKNLDLLEIIAGSKIEDPTGNLKSLSKLKSIRFSESTLDEGVIEELTQMESIINLFFDKTRFSNKNWLSALADMPNLHTLMIVDTKLTPNDLLSLKKSASLRYVLISDDLYEQATDIIQEIKKVRPRLSIVACGTTISKSLISEEEKEAIRKKVFNKSEWIGKSMDLFAEVYGLGPSLDSGFRIYLYMIEEKEYRITVSNKKRLIEKIELN